MKTNPVEGAGPVVYGFVLVGMGKACRRVWHN